VDANSLEDLPSGIRMCLRALPGGVRAEGSNTEHLFGFMIGSTNFGDFGELPEPDYRRFAKNAGN